MDQCLRIALGMLLLFGYLQAIPVSPADTGAPLPFNTDDLHLTYLRSKISCEKNVTFISCTSPSAVPEHCYNATLERFFEGLEKVNKTCTGELDQHEYTLEALEEGSKKLSQPTTLKNASGCKWESKQFADFVNDIESFVQMVNMRSSKKA